MSVLTLSSRLWFTTQRVWKALTFKSNKAPVWRWNASGWATQTIQHTQKYSFYLHLVHLQLSGVYVCVWQATESVDHIADLWRSADEDLRSAARETVLSFGTNMNYSSFSFSFIRFYFLLFLFYFLLVHLQVKRASWPSRGWTSCTLRCRRRRTRTKRLRLRSCRKHVQN